MRSENAILSDSTFDHEVNEYLQQADKGVIRWYIRKQEEGKQLDKLSL